MKVLVVLCVIVTTILAENLMLLTPAPWTARQFARYDPFFDPPTNIARGKPLSHIPENQRQYACTVDRTQYYKHGELFRISHETRCVTYRCEFGSYQIYQDGCLDVSSQRCVPVGHNWSVRCHIFLCSKTAENGMLRYEGLRNAIGCYDQLTNTCRRENELFSYRDQAGVIRNRCTCRIIPGASEIACFGNNERVNYVLSQA